MHRILELVQSGDFDPLEEFTGDKDKFLEVKSAFENISNNLPKEVCVNFVLTKIAPTVFDKSVAGNVRDEAVEVGLHVLQFVNIAILSTKEQEDVFNSVEESYVKIIGELRDNNYPNWDKLWIFLIKLCSDKLHSKMSLANKLLRVVEVAFRNSTSIEQRLKAYDCWVELINNSSLNMQHMCSAKQIKLLMTPMKAKFSRMPVVIMKRCDTFVYLLEKLEDRATLCLKEFLEFCFGPFDEKHDVQKMKQGRSVSEVCNKSTLVLLEIIGHSHTSLENCLKSDLHLYKPLITDVNFPNFAEILINSVIECCVLLNEWSQDALKNNTIIKCLWRSVLQFIRNSSDDVKKKCYSQINNCLRNLSERSHYNDYLHTVLANVIDLLIRDDMGDKLKETVFDVSIHLLHHFTDSCSFSLDNVQSFVVSCFDNENGSKFDKIASNSFKNNAKCENSILCEVWLKCKIAVGMDSISTYVWPIRYLQNFSSVEALRSKWTKLYATECKSDGVKVVIMQEMEKLFLENPLLSSNIVQFLELISSGENSPSKDFVAKLMRLTELVLTLPNLSDDDVTKISSVVLTYCNQTQHFYKSENVDETLDKLCGCLEHLMAIHKDYTVLTKLTELLANGHPKILSKFSKRLMTFLEALMLNEDNTIANDTRKLIELFECKSGEQEPISLGSSRSLRIINMTNTTPKTRRSIGDTNSTKVSPALSLKRPVSTLRGKSRADTKKKKDPVSINEDNSADYVKIDTQVKINVDNLNEHQKEMFKKRREDIPALYQELTQSQSQDFFKTIENAKEKDEDNEVRKKSPSKKRRRSNDDEEHVSKARKIQNEESELNESIIKVLFPDNVVAVTADKEKLYEADDSITQIPDEMDSDLRKIFDDVEQQPVQKAPPEDIFQDPVDATIKSVADEETLKIDGVVDELLENGKSEVLEGNIRVSPRSTKAKRTPDQSPEKGVRKSQRNTARKIREELVNAVKKQLEQLEEQAELKDETTPESKTEESVHENEDEKKENIQETSVRKSKRQIKKRHSDCMVTFEKKKIEEVKTVSQSSEDDFVPKPEEKHKSKKKQRRQSLPIQTRKNSVDESMEELLARIDKRIEENKKTELKKQDDELNLPDSNDNEIIQLCENKTEESKDQEIRLKTSKKDLFAVKREKRLSLPVSITTAATKEDPMVSLSVTVDNVRDLEPSPTISDVYEFKADEETLVIDEVKKRKPRRKGLTFNRSDYVTKRRKRPKKETRDDGFFHVTADSPVPLSQSSSLRAVPSSQTSETITILITRSPPDSSKENSDSSTASNPTLSSPKKKNRRKLSPNSEDLIESSQQPVPNSPNKKSRSLKQAIEETNKLLDSPDFNKRQTRSSQKDIESADTETMSLDVVPEKENKITPLRITRTRRFSLTEPSSQKVVGKRLKRSRSLEKLDFTGDAIKFSIEKLTKEKEEEIVHVNDSSVDTLTCESDKVETATSEADDVREADTLTLSLTPVTSPTKNDLPGSPITCDTPERTSEFLNNTSEISPISSTSEVTTPTPKVTNEVSSRRVAKLLQMVNSNVQVSEEGRRWFGNKLNSPSSGRIRKMRMKKEENLDILTFSREVPSPLTLPASGILKRKFNSLDEAATPSPKRKRVNFSDPAITERKLFIKHAEEYEIDENESQDDDFTNNKKTKGFLETFELNHALFDFKDFRDSNPKDVSPLGLKRLLQNLKAPEVVDVITDYLNCLDDEAADEFKNALSDAGSSGRIVDQFVVPLLEKAVNFEVFLPKLVQVVEKQPKEIVLNFVDQVRAVCGDERINSISADVSQQQVEDHIVGLDCDKMQDLIKKYFSNLQDQQRNDFLVDVMSLASNQLPASKEFVNSHVDILKSFVQKMTD